MMGTTVQYLVAWANRCLGIVHLCRAVSSSASSNGHNTNSLHTSPKWCIIHTVTDTDTLLQFRMQYFPS